MDWSSGLTERSRVDGRVWAALVAIYVFWGATFLAIRVAVSEIPPFLMAGFRWTSAGLVLFAIARRRSKERITPAHVGSAAAISVLLIVASNGVVSWAEQRVASGPSALLVGSVSLWLVLFDWALPGGARPRPRVLLGLVLGLAGVGLLTGVSGAERIDPAGAAALLLASASFAAGSLLTRHAPHPTSGLLTSALQMLTGGGLLLLVGSALHEWHRFPAGAPTHRGILAVTFLAVFGSLLGFTLYAWLVRTAPPALVSTYPCVNPVVAVLLGAIFLGEPLTLRTLVATAIIAASVGLIVSARSAPRNASEPRPVDGSPRLEAAATCADRS